MKYSWILIILVGCSTPYKISNLAKKDMVNNTALANTNMGICLYNATSNEYLYNYNAQKYYVPASNTKILTCYAAMKYLGDSLVGLRYKRKDSTYQLFGTADPTFMHPDFATQPVLDFFKNTHHQYYINNNHYNEEPYGDGWAWNDYTEDYMAERSSFPIYGNVFEIKKMGKGVYESYPTYFLKPKNVYSNTNEATRTQPFIANDSFDIMREKNSNYFNFKINHTLFTKQTVPFITSPDLTLTLVYDSLQTHFAKHKNYITYGKQNVMEKIYSQPTDSMLKPMMHYSDNFFAEQSLLLVSNEKLGIINDEAIINYIKNNDFVGIPQMPRWVDGSGLSRYNMITPQALVWVLNKMKNEFGMERIKNIFATGGEGTLSNLYKAQKGLIYAKTGTLSNHTALSGYLYTKHKQLIIFSVLTSGYQGSATPTRKAIEKLLTQIQQLY